MPQVFALALIGAGAIAGYRWIARQLDAVTHAANQAEAAQLTPPQANRRIWDSSNGMPSTVSTARAQMVEDRLRATL
jgi:hypothetical protein